MVSIRSFALPLAAAALALAGLVVPTIAPAQDMPSYAQPIRDETIRDETIRGRIISINGTFSITLRDERGFVDNVELHQGTIINPVGLMLEPGMSITIVGVNNGSVFEANEIDSPYTYYGAPPETVYLGPGWWYPGFGYGYGPSFSLVLVFGNGFFFQHRPFFGHPFFGHPFFGRPGCCGHTWGGNTWGGNTRPVHPAPRVPQGNAQVRTVEPVMRAPQGAWRSYDASRSGYTAPSSGVSTTRAYGTGETRAYGTGESRVYGGESRGFGGESRGFVRTYSAPSASTGVGSGGGGGHGPH